MRGFRLKVIKGAQSDVSGVCQIGAISVVLREADDVPRAIELLRLSYELAVKQKSRSVEGR